MHITFICLLFKFMHVFNRNMHILGPFSSHPIYLLVGIVRGRLPMWPLSLSYLPITLIQLPLLSLPLIFQNRLLGGFP